MSAELTAALVAGSVSLIVAAATVAITALSTRATLRRDQDRHEADLRRKMTERLYDRRVATYPALFAATGAFRWSTMANASDIPEHLRAAIATIDEMHSGELGLLLSAPAHRRLLELRQATRQAAEASDHDEMELATKQVWLCKNRLRDALRADLGLLFDEEPTPMGREIFPGTAPDSLP